MISYTCKFCLKAHNEVESWARCERICGFKKMKEIRAIPTKECDEQIHIVFPSTSTCICNTLVPPGDFLR